MGLAASRLSLAVVAACSNMGSAGGGPIPLSSSLAAMRFPTATPNPDPRVGLAPGKIDSTGRNITQKAGEAAWNMRLVSNSPTTEGFKGVTGTIAFDEKGDIKNGALTLYTFKDGKREQIAVVR